MQQRQPYVEGQDSYEVLCFPTANDPSATQTQGEWLIYALSHRTQLTSEEKRRVVDAMLDNVGVSCDDVTVAGLHRIAADCAIDILKDVFGRRSSDAISEDERRRYIRILFSNILDAFENFQLAVEVLSLGIQFGRAFLISMISRQAAEQPLSLDEQTIFVSLSRDSRVMDGFHEVDRGAISQIARTLCA